MHLNDFTNYKKNYNIITTASFKSHKIPKELPRIMYRKSKEKFSMSVLFIRDMNFREDSYKPEIDMQFYGQKCDSVICFTC